MLLFSPIRRSWYILWHDEAMEVGLREPGDSCGRKFESIDTMGYKEVHLYWIGKREIHGQVLIRNPAFLLARRKGNGRPTSSNKESSMKRYMYVRCEQGNYTKVQIHHVSPHRSHPEFIATLVEPKRDESHFAV